MGNSINKKYEINEKHGVIFLFIFNNFLQFFKFITHRSPENTGRFSIISMFCKMLF